MQERWWDCPDRPLSPAVWVAISWECKGPPRRTFTLRASGPDLITDLLARRAEKRLGGSHRAAAKLDERGVICENIYVMLLGEGGSAGGSAGGEELGEVK